eukprot:555218-Prymnesium_polylepis.1
MAAVALASPSCAHSGWEVRHVLSGRGGGRETYARAHTRGGRALLRDGLASRAQPRSRDRATVADGRAGVGSRAHLREAFPHMRGHTLASDTWG